MSKEPDELLEIYRKAFEKSTLNNLRLRGENTKLQAALADYDRELDAFASMTFSADSEVSAQEMAKQDLDMLRKRHGHLLSEKANEVKP